MDRIQIEQLKIKTNWLNTGGLVVNVAHREFWTSRTVDFDLRYALTKITYLTGREREVFDLVGRGLANRQISRQLGVAEQTVKSHVSHILRILGLESRTQAAIVAFVTHAATDVDLYRDDCDRSWSSKVPRHY